MTTKADFLAKMFMLYDCQPYSAMLTGKIIKYMSKIARNKFTFEFDSDSVIIAKDNINSLLSYLDAMSSFLKALGVKQSTEDDREKIKFLLNNKHKIFALEKALAENGRKGIHKTMQDYIGEDPEAVGQKLAEFLIYSRTVPVETILELIGDKREGELLKHYMKKFEPLMFNKNIEKALREILTSFRLAGVESQTVERVLESFGHFYYDFSQNFTSEEGIIKFTSRQETYDFVYLLLMLQTCHHNPNIVNKTNFKWFVDSVRDLCKEGYPSMKEKDLLDIFRSIEMVEFDSPLTRNLNLKPFTLESLPIELYVRTKVQDPDAKPLEEEDFINCLLFESDKKLFHHHNTFAVPDSLVDLSKVYISELILKDIKKLLTDNIESDNFVMLFDKVFEICFNFGREDILEEIMHNMFEKVQWTKYYEELTDTELNLCSCLIIYLCKWVARFKKLAPHVPTILAFAYENVSTD